jgi:hypothetical protein
MTRTNPTLVVAMLKKALEHFGSITPENRLEVGRWVQAQCEGKQPDEFDAKQRAAGRDE